MEVSKQKQQERVSGLTTRKRRGRRCESCVDASSDSAFLSLDIKVNEDMQAETTAPEPKAD